jgi:hypothetical protein
MMPVANVCEDMPCRFQCCSMHSVLVLLVNNFDAPFIEHSNGPSGPAIDHPKHLVPHLSAAHPH